MAIDMNVDLGSIIKGLFSKKDSKEGQEVGIKTPQSPHVKTAIVSVLILILIAAYVFFVYLPTQEDLRIKNEKISQIESLKYEIDDLSNSIEQAKIDLVIAQKEYERRTTLFHTDKELEDLYGQISLLAMQNKLTITKIEKGVERPIFSEGVCSDDSSNEDEIVDEGMFVEEGEFIDEEGAGQLQNVGYYEFVVNLEISGNYSQFTSFRSGLSQLDKIININKESIVVPGTESSGGDVKIASSIATYRLPKNEAEKCQDPSTTMEEEF